MNGHRFHGDYHQRMHSFDAASSMLSSDLETTSFLDSEDDSRYADAEKFLFVKFAIVLVHCIEF